MARIGILTCSNAAQDLGCSSVSSLAELRKRRGAFVGYPADEPLDLVGIINYHQLSWLPDPYRCR